MPLFPLCHIKLAETVNEKCYLFSCKQGFVHFFLQNADFKLAFCFFQLVQPLLGGWGKNPCLNSVEHIVNTFFRFCKLFFQKWQVGAFFLLQLHQRINQPLHDFIIHNCFHGIIDNQIFNPVFLDRFLVTELLFLSIHTAIITVYFHCMACAAFSHHERAAFPTVQLRCQKVIILGFVTGRSFFVLCQPFLYPFKQLFRDNRRNTVLLDYITIAVFSHVTAVL